MMVDTISFRDLDCYLDSERVHIIDLRNRRAYGKSHLRGAENIPFNELEGCVGRLSKGDKILFYCDRGNSSLMACRNLNKRGFQTRAVMGMYDAYHGKYLT